MTDTYSLEEAADIICGGHTPAALYWLSQRLRGNAKPALVGYKSQGRWRMTGEQVADALTVLAPKRTDVPDVPLPSGLMSRSKRKLAS